MLEINDGPSVFVIRVAGIAMQGGRVLLHQSAQDNFWSLPGGHVEFWERSGETLQREMLEEMGAQVEVGPLVWVVENFYAHDGRTFHEIGFYYRMTLPEDSPFIQGDGPYFGVESANLPLTFRWFALDELDSITVLPLFLLDGLRAMPDAVTHIVSYE